MSQIRYTFSANILLFLHYTCKPEETSNSDCISEIVLGPFRTDFTTLVIVL